MSSSSSSEPGLEGSEYTRRTRERRQKDATSSTSGRTRFVYFGAASLWGFLVGALAVGLAAQLSGTNPGLLPAVAVALVPGAGLALAGGAATASAYREARKRRTR